MVGTKTGGVKKFHRRGRWWGRGRLSERKGTKETQDLRGWCTQKGRSKTSQRPNADSLEGTPPCRFCVGPAHAWWGITPPCPMIGRPAEGLSPPTNSPSRLPLHIRIPPPSPPTSFFFLSLFVRIIPLRD